MINRQKMKDDEYVLLHFSKRRSYLIRIEKGKSFHTHKGYIELDDLIDNEYGRRFTTSLSSEFVTLKPSLRDFIVKAQRRTQIMYPKDIALIVMFSGIGPNSQVVEAGTGAGALTTALAYYVRPHGRVFTYEIRPEFQEVAIRNLEKAQVRDFVELKCKDVILGIDEKNVDAIVLDLATPWLVVSHAYSSLKNAGSLVSFSPTLDQVVNTVESLEGEGFVDIGTFECMMREMQVVRGRTRPQTFMTGHTGYITYARKAFE